MSEKWLDFKELKRCCSSVPVLACALISALLAAFAFMAGYSNETVFATGTTTICDVASYLGVYGKGAGAALVALSFVIEILGLSVFMKVNRRQKIWSAAVALLLALTLAIPIYNSSHSQATLDSAATPPYVSEQYRTKWFWIYSLMRYVGFAAFLLPVMAIVLTWAVNKLTTSHKTDDSLSEHTVENPQNRVTVFLHWLYSRLHIGHAAIIGAIVFTLWLPWCISLWPANIAADTVAQLVWARTGQAWDPSSRMDLIGYALSDHHPWFDTLIYGFFDKLGLAMGSEAWGLWLLALIQTMSMAFVFGVVFNYLCAVFKLSWKFGAFFTLFTALVPVYGRLTAVVVKDMTALPFFLLFVVLFIEYVRRIRNRIHLSPWLLAGLVVVSVLCCLTRKINLEIIVIAFLLLAVVLRRRLVSALLGIVIAVIMSIIPNIVYPALHIAPGGVQEMLAIPLQQSAMTLVKYGDKMSVQDREAIEAVFTCPTEDLSNLLNMATEDGREVVNADGIKDRCFDRTATKGELVRYLLVWLKQAFQHPKTYLNAVAWLRNPFLIGSVYDEGWYVRGGWPEKGGNMILPQYDEGERSKPQYYGSTFYTLASQMPGVSFLMTEGLYVSWVPLMTIALCCLTRRYRNLTYMIPWLLSIGTLLMLPAPQTRYTWTLLFGTALIVAIPAIRDDASQERKSPKHHDLRILCRRERQSIADAVKSEQQ